ncbi:glycine-rich domain-containing protein [Streptomyces sp. DSM 40484]|uniref:glycine-rich domain-containing protein n=1 Tax=Streptomyces kroppenstedtii TaxID=3051181 RepID=UPI0028D6B3A5|nr:glycine-rich domain-containing protein-like [Streptomyces sp. DSM 40484]
MTMTSMMDRIEIPDSIRELDLTVVRGKLADRATRGREVTNPPVALDSLDQAVEDYRKFLALCEQFRGFPIVPSYDMDEVWHQHVLFTEKYRTDCTTVFGEFFEHVPYFGRAEANVEEDDVVLTNTRALWEKVYGYIPASYEGMTAPTSSGGWSGTVDLTNGKFMSWAEQEKILRG